MRVFIGYDPREAIAFHILAKSIWARSSVPVSITPLMLNQLPMTRERHPLQSTEFSFSRFLVPYLCDYEGWALFMDCDMLCQDDVAKIWDLRDSEYAVQVVKHNHIPDETVKFLGATQTKYEKKNWSSVMLFNNERCRVLTPEYVNAASGLELHQFKWLGNDDLIGSLPKRWNHLAESEKPAFIHYTVGGPYFEQYRDCEYSREWFSESDIKRMKSKTLELVGNSPTQTVSSA